MDHIELQHEASVVLEVREHTVGLVSEMAHELLLSLGHNLSATPVVDARHAHIARFAAAPHSDHSFLAQAHMSGQISLGLVKSSGGSNWR